MSMVSKKQWIGRFKGVATKYLDNYLYFGSYLSIVAETKISISINLVRSPYLK